MEMVSLINGVTGDHNNRSNHEMLGRNKIILDEQPAYDKAKELETCSERFSKSNTVLVLWSIGDLYIFCESYQIISNDERIRLKSSMFTESTHAYMASPGAPAGIC